MTNRENFLRAIQRHSPERVPLNTGYSRLENIGDCICLPVAEVHKGEWPYMFSKTKNDKSMGLVNVHPLKTIEDVLAFAPPAVEADARFAGTALLAEKGKKRDKFVFGGVGSFVFERLHYLIGMEDLFDYLYNEPEIVQIIGDKIVNYQCDIIREFSRCGVDGIWGGDDWGLQDRLMINPVKWREFFKPWYTAIFQTARDCGMITYMHSCGKNNEIMQDLIDCGLDVVELHQPTVYGVDWLNKNVGGKICVSATADIQKTLPTGDKILIEQEVRDLRDKLGCFNGGLMYILYNDPAAIGVTDETEQFYLEMCRKYSR